MNMIKTICLLGFGEVGSTLAIDLLQHSEANIVAWDIQFADSESLSNKRYASIESSRLRKASDTIDAVNSADLVISAVTAQQALPAAKSVIQNMTSQAWYLDLNSVSPGTKIELAEQLTQTGARFVEAAVMAPIAPKRIAAPILLAGVHAGEFLPLARELGFSNMSVLSDNAGQAAASKMCRSVMIKGMEALITEALLTARHYDVEQSVLDSLNNLFPHPNWQAQSAYMISRSLEHGVRRAEEMREVAKTVQEAEVDSWMSSACVERQQWAGELSYAKNNSDFESADLVKMLDTIRCCAAQTSR
ncbi:MAG: DUF1932 domain-containing protein [Pseudomonadales bacterium]